MKKFRLIFYIIFSAYHLFVFVFSIYVKSRGDDVGFLFGLQQKLIYFVWGSLVGIFLLAIDVSWDYLSTNAFNKEKDRLQNEVNALKAKLYDMQGGPKEKTLDSEKEKQEH